VFFGRFIAVLRVTAAWLAGVSRMHWWEFFLWNAAGGICWATLVGLVAYYVGHAAAEAISKYGLIGGTAIVVLLVLGAIVVRYVRRRMLRAEGEAPHL
jgi:membrane protein DedA with SNARE-associated domain